LLLDEAQILGSAAWSSILPTMSARENPQAWLLGTPPTPQDDGEVFARLRQRGIEGKDSRLAYLEWSADEGDDLDDVATWAKANPAYGTRISVEAIEAERWASRLGRIWRGLRSRSPVNALTMSGTSSLTRTSTPAVAVSCGCCPIWSI
jgi:phage terminase large subunit-like protein